MQPMKCLETNNYEPIIRECFDSDKDLLTKYHIEAPADLDTCVSRTVHDLMDVDRYKFYSIMSGNEVAGFFGKELVAVLPFLTGFFLKPKYRTEYGKECFWKLIKEKIGDNFMSAIYLKNTRADNFLSKQKHSRREAGNHVVFNINLQ